MAPRSEPFVIQIGELVKASPPCRRSPVYIKQTHGGANALTRAHAHASHALQKEELLFILSNRVDP